MAPSADWLRTWIGVVDTATASRVAGRDLPREIMGRLTLTELAYLLVDAARADAGRAPAARRGARVARRPRAHAERARGPAHLHRRARGDPGRGRGRAARRGQRVPRPGRRHRAVPRSTRSRDATPTRARRRRAARASPRSRSTRVARRGARVPGLGHPVHKDDDPRTPRLYEIAERGRPARPAPAAARARRRRCTRSAAGKHLPINGAGAGGAALVDLGLPPSSVRGFVLIARTAGPRRAPRRRGRATRSACRCGSRSKTAPATPTDRRRGFMAAIFSLGGVHAPMNPRRRVATVRWR